MEKLNARYTRHYSFKGFGSTAQQKLTNAKVLVIGAGGLGCPVLQYLAAAGVGTIGIADNDIVDLSNLQRQVLYGNEDVGLQKVIQAAAKLHSLNSDIIINAHAVQVTAQNAFDLIQDYDIVVDCTDNFAARYVINDACVLLNKPLIFGAIYEYEGQVAVFNIADANGALTNYRNLFPKPPDNGDIPDCNEAGVLGVLPGIIGTMQATEVIKIITGIGEILINKLFIFNMLDYSTYCIDISNDNVDENLVNYNEDIFTTASYHQICKAIEPEVKNIGPREFALKQFDPDTLIIDVRESGELPIADFLNINIPLSGFEQNCPEINHANVIVICKSGHRSERAAEMLIARYGNSKNVCQLKGGLDALRAIAQE